MVSLAQKAVKQFKKKYNITEVTLPNLLKALSEQGYTVIEFNSVFNGEEVDSLIESLGIYDFVRSSRCFTYVDNNYRLVFLNEDLTEEEKIIVLSHEEGHIYCNHFKNSPIIGKDVVEEKEANEFSHYLIKKSLGSNVADFTKKHKTAVIASLLSMIFLISVIAVFTSVSHRNIYYEDYYVTDTGKKYHTEDCMYVKNKSNIERLTREAFETGQYEPCDVCIGQK